MFKFFMMLLLLAHFTATASLPNYFDAEDESTQSILPLFSETSSTSPDFDEQENRGLCQSISSFFATDQEIIVPSFFGRPLGALIFVSSTILIVFESVITQDFKVFALGYMTAFAAYGALWGIVSCMTPPRAKIDVFRTHNSV